MTLPTNILVVEDDLAQRQVLTEILTSGGYSVRVAGNGAEALDELQIFSADLVLTDLQMPIMDGLELLKRLNQKPAPPPVVLMTALVGVETAVVAMREGAFDYLTKPLNVDELLLVIERSLERRRLAGEAQALRGQVEELSRFNNIIGSSPEMRQVFTKITQIAPSRATVLLEGESGTGKEMVAAAIHHRSGRAAGPFVRLHCGALAESLLESELFGHERGSFTGAARQRLGRFEQADGGSLFLDEIGEISSTTQVKLLRVLQERSFERVGGNDTIRVDVRVIAATNRDLKEMVRRGQFREDLYYRLNVISLRLPPLRERTSDIPILAGHFLGLYANENEKALRGFTDEAMALLVSYDWPGNVREIENVVQRAVVLAEGEFVESRHLPLELTKQPKRDGLPVIPGASLLELERYAIMKTLEAFDGSVAKTAATLGVSVRKIQYRLQEYRGPRESGMFECVSGHPNRRIALRASR